mgnify:CR=1 FL=1
MIATVQIKQGDKVQLKASVRKGWVCPEGRDDNASATVKALLTNTEGGLFLDRDLHGCRYWNVADVRVVN